MRMHILMKICADAMASENFSFQVRIQSFFFKLFISVARKFFPTINDQVERSFFLVAHSLDYLEPDSKQKKNYQYQ